ncbi:carbohydrate ABC transporter membrane protein 1, CUT1 family [Streptomyces sp. DvalAA-14]|uniref:carbohydrate ABC transporter permease n=1 Tax=unclassified Streptomyces TaxID=2593676 RepID=UPI00081BB6AC|nr:MULTISPECIES: sugar ABC transporter permease [unclassified Streptomyces]MYS22445.1 ABC transporter permease subunit [Streptomyces sp. SID4948]SCE16483.1 carbohydrate ABC transporter membrane protein 1, CUT1 family [Streptomyces sp. DvalAA-14]
MADASVPGAGGGITGAAPAAPGPVTGPGAGRPPARLRRSIVGTRPWVAALFLLPALILLGALVAYPIGFTVYRSLYDADGSGFVGLKNFGTVFSDHGILTAVRNNAIWVVVAPTVATALGLVFAVLTERVRWGTAFKLVVFMPMAISMLAAGIIFRLVYEQDPARGVANAVVVAVHDTFTDNSAYPGARPRPGGDLAASAGGSYTSKSTAASGTPADLPLVGIPQNKLPAGARQAEPAASKPDAVTGTVWLDFRPGGTGKPGVIDPGEKALSGVKVQAVKGGKVIASATSAKDGTYTLPGKAIGAQLRLPASNFSGKYGGINWLGPDLVTPSIIASYVWMWAGFAMVLIAAGLAGVPRELLEQARVDGANEWQVFRRITVPLLAPVLVVVMVTLMINVLKIFDLVYIIAPGNTQSNANVLALQLYLSSFGGGDDQGVGSAIGVILLLLVLPVMIFNIRRLRREGRR